jgi:cysteine-rich repeat protein
MRSMLTSLRIAVSCLPLVIFGGCGGGGSGARCVPGANVDCACGTNPHGAKTCTAQGTYSACACAGSMADAGGLGGAGGTTSSGTGGQGEVSSDSGGGGVGGLGSTGGVGGVTTPSTSNGGVGGEASLPADASVSGTGGTTIPSTSNGGAGGAGGTTAPATLNGGAGGAGGTSIPSTLNGGAGGAGGTTVPATLNGGAGGAGGTTSSAICGNGKLEGGEGCDDGNIMPFDGCSSDCQIEPDCSGASCTSACGDGLVFGSEQCDDGNHASGDGCSADCKLESGWTCTQPPVGNKIMVPVVYRDFRFHNPTDFEPASISSFAAFPGIVNATLDADGKPVYSGIGGNALVASADTFAEWYRDVPAVNHATSSKMPLWDNGKGGYVNRYGPNGEQWNMTEVAYFCGTVGQELSDATGSPIPCTDKDPTYPSGCTAKLAAGEEMLKCDVVQGVYQGTFIVSKVDGNPLFFPVDGDTFTPASELAAAQVPEFYDPSLPYDVDQNGKQRLHNFSFTSEVRYWFKYESRQHLPAGLRRRRRRVGLHQQEAGGRLGRAPSSRRRQYRHRRRRQRHHDRHPDISHFSAPRCSTLGHLGPARRPSLRNRGIPGRASDHRIDLQVDPDRL